MNRCCTTCDDYVSGCRGIDSLCNKENNFAEWREPRQQSISSIREIALKQLTSPNPDHATILANLLKQLSEF